MAKRTEVYVDTSAFIAFLDRSDTHHALYRDLFAEPPQLLTSSLVIAEGHAWFLKRYDQYRAVQFLNFAAELEFLKISAVGEVEIKEGSEFIKKYRDQELTLADAVGLYLMKFHRIRLCWATDRHLGLIGVALISR